MSQTRAHSHWPHRAVRIGEVGDDRSGRAVTDAEIEMRRTRIVEVDRPLHQPHAQDVGEEVFDSPRVRADRGDVMDSPQPHPWGGGGYRDRKRTRLNSSHVNISYAVFC